MSGCSTQLVYISSVAACLATGVSESGGSGALRAYIRWQWHPSEWTFALPRVSQQSELRSSSCTSGHGPAHHPSGLQPFHACRLPTYWQHIPSTRRNRTLRRCSWIFLTEKICFCTRGLGGPAVPAHQLAKHAGSSMATDRIHADKPKDTNGEPGGKGFAMDSPSGFDPKANKVVTIGAALTTVRRPAQLGNASPTSTHCVFVPPSVVRTG